MEKYFAKNDDRIYIRGLDIDLGLREIIDFEQIREYVNNYCNNAEIITLTKISKKQVQYYEKIIDNHNKTLNNEFRTVNEMINYAVKILIDKKKSVSAQEISITKEKKEENSEYISNLKVFAAQELDLYLKEMNELKDYLNQADKVKDDFIENFEKRLETVNQSEEACYNEWSSIMSVMKRLNTLLYEKRLVVYKKLMKELSIKLTSISDKEIKERETKITGLEQLQERIFDILIKEMPKLDEKLDKVYDIIKGCPNIKRFNKTSKKVRNKISDICSEMNLKN